MALPKHLEAAAASLTAAADRIEEARARTPDLVSLRDWLAALTDYAMALAEVQECNNESLHEKLHALAGHLGFEKALDRP